MRKVLSLSACVRGRALKSLAVASVGAATAGVGLTALNNDNETSPAALGGTAPYFSVIGSAGVVDDTNGEFAVRNGANLQVDLDMPVDENLVARYPVYAVQNLTQPFTVAALSARFRDNGNGARVLIRLREVEIGNGTTNTLMTFDSDTMGENSGYQTDSEVDNDPNWQFDFVENAYYLEVTLSKTRGNGKPAISAIQLIGL